MKIVMVFNRYSIIGELRDNCPIDEKLKDSVCHSTTLTVNTPGAWSMQASMVKIIVSEVEHEVN